MKRITLRKAWIIEQSCICFSPGIRSNSLIRSTSSSNQNVPSSVIQHSLANLHCTSAYNLNMFIILENTGTELQLSVLEVLYIIKYQPILCKQKELYYLLFFNPSDYTATKLDQVKNKTSPPSPKKLTNSSSITPRTIFTNTSARAGYDTRSIFKRSLTGLNSEFSFS